MKRPRVERRERLFLLLGTLALLALMLRVNPNAHAADDEATSLSTIEQLTRPGVCPNQIGEQAPANGAAIPLEGGNRYYAIGGILTGGTNDTIYGLAQGAYWSLREPGDEGRELLRVQTDGHVDAPDWMHAQVEATYAVHDTAILTSSDSEVNGILQIVRFDLRDTTAVRIVLGPTGHGETWYPEVCMTGMGPLADQDENGRTHLSILNAGESPTDPHLGEQLQNNGLNVLGTPAVWVPAIIGLLVVGLLLRSLLENN